MARVLASPIRVVEEPALLRFNNLLAYLLALKQSFYPNHNGFWGGELYPPKESDSRGFAASFHDTEIA